MLSVVRTGFSMAESGLDEDMRRQLLEAVGLAVAERISSFGSVDEIEELEDGRVAMRLFLDGVDDDADLAVGRVGLAEDGSQLALSGFSSSIPLAAKLVKGLFASPWEVEDGPTRLALNEIALSLS